MYAQLVWACLCRRKHGLLCCGHSACGAEAFGGCGLGWGALRRGYPVRGGRCRQVHCTTWRSAGVAARQCSTAQVLGGWSWGPDAWGQAPQPPGSWRWALGVWGVGAVGCTPLAWARGRGGAPHAKGRWPCRPGLVRQAGAAGAATAGRGLCELPGGRDSYAGEGGQGTAGESSAGSLCQARWQQLPLLGCRDRAVALAGGD